jgi:hypothetical protein
MSSCPAHLCTHPLLVHSCPITILTYPLDYLALIYWFQEIAPTKMPFKNAKYSLHAVREESNIKNIQIPPLICSFNISSIYLNLST